MVSKGNDWVYRPNPIITPAKRNKRPYLKILLAHYPICITLPEIVIEKEIVINVILDSDGY